MMYASSSYDCSNPMYSADVPGYPTAPPQNANISISAVVSASCFIVNDQYHQGSNSNVQLQFNQQDLNDTYDDSIPAQLGNTAYQHPAANNVYDPRVDDFNLTANPDAPEHTAQTTFCQQAYLENNDFSVPPLDSNEVMNINRFHEQIPVASCGDTLSRSCSQMYSGEETEFPVGDLDQRSSCFNAQASVSMSSCDSYFSDSSQPAEFDMSCRLSAATAAAAVDDSSREGRAQPAAAGRSKAAKTDVNVDEMISNGVTVAGFKPRGIIRKRKKSKTPNCTKDGGYWNKRTKNNDSARKSRETKKEMERKFYKRALELEYENFYLKERITNLEDQLSSIHGSGTNMNNIAFEC